MIQKKLESVKKIADTHVTRIQDALEHLKTTFPVTEHSVQKLAGQEFLYMKLLTNRFSKLQDHLGANVFDLFFLLNSENIDSMTMIDKLNKLEKLGIIEDVHIWHDMRTARNIIAHEYPDNPALIANTLNAIKTYCPILIAIKNALFKRMQSSNNVT